MSQIEGAGHPASARVLFVAAGCRPGARRRANPTPLHGHPHVAPVGLVQKQVGPVGLGHRRRRGPVVGRTGERGCVGGRACTGSGHRRLSQPTDRQHHRRRQHKDHRQQREQRSSLCLVHHRLLGVRASGGEAQERARGRPPGSAIRRCRRPRGWVPPRPHSDPRRGSSHGRRSHRGPGRRSRAPAREWWCRRWRSRRSRRRGRP